MLNLAIVLVQNVSKKKWISLTRDIDTTYRDLLSIRKSGKSIKVTIASTDGNFAMANDKQR
jgi:hypothetical protein